jgi:hypothetical protein
MDGWMKYHINSKHEYGKQIFSNIKLAKIFLGNTDDGDVSLISLAALELLLLGV